MKYLELFNNAYDGLLDHDEIPLFIQGVRDTTVAGISAVAGQGIVGTEVRAAVPGTSCVTGAGTST